MSSVLALASALLLADAGDARPGGVPVGGPVGGFVERTAATHWSRPLLITEPAPSVGPLPSNPATAEAQGENRSGSFRLLTYNVAGLPQLVSKSRPERNMSLVSPLLNHYDLALVQEDFAYHGDLSARARHRYRSQPMAATSSLMPDGLNYFSRFDFSWLERVRWRRCNGFVSAASDCLADKGFTFARVTLASGSSVDVYNLHADAGGSPADVAVRRHNFEQLVAHIRKRSKHQALIVAGDTNLRMTNPADVETLRRFLAATDSVDACRRLRCGEERVDRVLYRSSRALELDVAGWWKDARFVDPEGSALSDHPAIGVELSWRRASPAPLMAER